MTPDERLQHDCQRVIDRLGPYPGVQVWVDHGWVALRGFVGHGVDRWTVEEAVSHVAGVVGTNAQLRVATGAAS